MKKFYYWSLSFAAFVALAFHTQTYAQQSTFSTPVNPDAQINYSSNNQNHQAFRIGIVNTKKCLEESKLGKQEQTNFEKMKQQMESVLQDKEKLLEEIEAKLNDDDYMDSISDEAASELKRKKRTIRNEGMQLQSQYMQTLQQANMKIVQKLTDVVNKASALIAQESINGHTLDIIFTDEACTFYSPHLDISERIIAKMNAIYDAEQKDNATKSR